MDNCDLDFNNLPLNTRFTMHGHPYMLKAYGINSCVAPCHGTDKGRAADRREYIETKRMNKEAVAQSVLLPARLSVKDMRLLGLPLGTEFEDDIGRKYVKTGVTDSEFFSATRDDGKILFVSNIGEIRSGPATYVAAKARRALNGEDVRRSSRFVNISSIMIRTIATLDHVVARLPDAPVDPWSWHKKGMFNE